MCQVRNTFKCFVTTTMLRLHHVRASHFEVVSFCQMITARLSGQKALQEEFDAYNGISNPMDSNPSAFESKNQSFFEYLDSKQIWIK